MMDLLNYGIGDGYCHAWYARRFLSPVQISEDASPHAGLGLDCYVQWTSPIRRFGDLQVHQVVKRFLRRLKVSEMLANGTKPPESLKSADLGCEPGETAESAFNMAGRIDDDIELNERGGQIRAARTLQRASERYWVIEYIRRLKRRDPDKQFDALVLGCVNPNKQQYAIYIYELGLEWRFVSTSGSLHSGMRLMVGIGSVLPHNGQLTLVPIN